MLFPHFHATYALIKHIRTDLGVTIAGPSGNQLMCCPMHPDLVRRIKRDEVSAALRAPLLTQLREDIALSP